MPCLAHSTLVDPRGSARPYRGKGPGRTRGFSGGARPSVRSALGVPCRGLIKECRAPPSTVARDAPGSQRTLQCRRTDTLVDPGGSARPSGLERCKSGCELRSPRSPCDEIVSASLKFSPDCLAPLEFFRLPKFRQAGGHPRLRPTVSRQGAKRDPLLSEATNPPGQRAEGTSPPGRGDCRATAAKRNARRARVASPSPQRARSSWYDGRMAYGHVNWRLCYGDFDISSDNHGLPRAQRMACRIP
jgi:hypothetical protein